jgi:undecaprenyl-diphosphatase
MSSMPEWLVVVILGVIEGITEFLPVSSTGHMLLAENWLPHRQSELFLVVIQSGAVLAVLTVFAGRLRQLLTNFNKPENRDFILKLGVAFVITAIGGLTLKKLGFRLEEKAGPVAWATLVGGFVILLVEAAVAGKQLKTYVTWPVAIAVGAGQLLAAAFPGTSRSGATILMALAMGVARPQAAEFSFLLGIPTILAASLFKIREQMKVGHEPVDWSMILLGSAVAAIVAFAVVKWLLRFVQGHTFKGFGWYRIILGIAILLMLRGK